MDGKGKFQRLDLNFYMAIALNKLHGNFNIPGYYAIFGRD